MRNFLLLLALLFLCSFSDLSLIKRISDAQFRYEFYTVPKKVTPKKDRVYYWFKGGAVHNTEYGFSGELLHDSFLKYYHSNQLAESGRFKNGLKEGDWKTWYENGVLQSDTEWDNGQKDGEYLSYDKTGFLTEKGYYSNGLKTGKWINYISKDTLKYRNGKIVVKKEKHSLKEKDTLVAKNNKGFFSRVFGKKTPAEDVKKKDKPKVKEAKKVNRSSQEKGFFSKLFRKNNNESKPNVKQASKKPVKKTDDKKSFIYRLFHKKEQKEE